MGVLVLAGAVAGAALLGRTDEMSREMTDDIQPARVAASRVTGGAARPGDRCPGLPDLRRSAVPQPRITKGSMTNMAAAEEVRRRLIGPADLITDLDAIETASASWRASYAEPLIASVAPNTPSLISSDTAERGKAEFDHMRALFDVENVRPGRGADECRATSSTSVDAWRDRVLIAMVIAFCRHGDTAGTADPLRGHHSAASAGRGMPTNHPGQLRRSHHAPAAAERHSRHRDRRGKHATAHRGGAGSDAVGPSPAG